MQVKTAKSQGNFIPFNITIAVESKTDYETIAQLCNEMHGRGYDLSELVSKLAWALGNNPQS